MTARTRSYGARGANGEQIAWVIRRFIEEVTEEVQRDRLFGLIKRYGWIAGVAVLLIVGGAAYNEWRKASERASAQAFGDALLNQIDGEYDASTALVASESPAQAAIAGHMAAARALSEGDTETGAAALEAVQNNAEVEAIYRELAAFKAALAMPMDGDAQARMDALDAITGPLRVLAQEQKAMVLIESGDRDAAAILDQSSDFCDALRAGRLRRAGADPRRGAAGRACALAGV